jgi:hypothetical protein
MMFIDGDLIFSNGDGSQYVELDTGFAGIYYSLLLHTNNTTIHYTVHYLVHVSML